MEVFDRGTNNAGNTGDATKNYYTDWISEKVLQDLNIKLSFVAIPRGEELQGVNARLAAHTAPDICYVYDAATVYYYYKYGGLTDLTDAVEKYGSDLKAFLGDNMQEGTFEGKLYAIVARRMTNAKFNTFIRQDWLEALNMPLPTNIEEFYNCLKAFKDQNPGKVSPIIPMTLTTDVKWRAGSLLESFIDPNISTKDFFSLYANDQEVLLTGYKEGVRFLNKLYNEGLLDPQFQTYKADDPADDLIKRGQVGVFIHNWDQAYRPAPGLYQELIKNVPTAKLVAVDTFKNSAGKYFKTVYNTPGLRNFVPIDSKDKAEAAVKYLNWTTIFENKYFLQTGGSEGETYEVVDGLPQLITLDASNPKKMGAANNVDYTPLVNGLDTGDLTLNIKALAGQYTGVSPDLILQAYNIATNDGYLIPTLPGVPLPVQASKGGQNLKDKLDAMMVAAITAKPEDFDKTWDQGMADYLIDAQPIVDERTAAWEQYGPK
jgi:putative aldouronate transport system substrate-binding protein